MKNTKTVKTILFASLIAAMILPFSGMNFAYAAEKTDKELIDEWNRSFSNKITSGEEPSDEIKIDIMKGLYEAMENPKPLTDAEIKYYKEQAEVLEKATALNEQINKTSDPETKKALEAKLKAMKPRMAEVGIFAPEDVDNEELLKIQNEYRGTSLDPFQSPENFFGLVIQYAHAALGQYQTFIFLQFGCGGFQCESAKTLAYLDPGESMNASIVVPGYIDSPINTLEHRYRVGNLQASQWQAGYHQAIHYDANWNYVDGDTRTSNEWYPSQQYSSHTVHASYNVDGGDQTYQYLYFYP
ncbi:hypothetical protein [Nitrosopumilus ureiphilus]|uniref:Uncharacterized protein n=1 Tax=Nitrosopumilus ureiphilus TaxID=1470067 RepID=A0A7D5M5K3_9ARCH|nr:hypothetical protein [Nitrosopumilus ureiphilus]QLH07152.1 hypothetical protein C5F50_08740 [Nitrosopumilus ureiphilus]